MIVQRVEKHFIKQNNLYYPMFCDFTHKSKNLYNHANDVNGAYQIMKKSISECIRRRNRGCSVTSS